MQVIYSVVVICNIRISSFLIQKVYGFDTVGEHDHEPGDMLFFKLHFQKPQIKIALFPLQRV